MTASGTLTVRRSVSSSTVRQPAAGAGEVAKGGERAGADGLDRRGPHAGTDPEEVACVGAGLGGAGASAVVGGARVGGGGAAGAAAAGVAGAAAGVAGAAADVARW